MAKKAMATAGNLKQTRRAKHLEEIPAMKASVSRRSSGARRASLSSGNDERDMKEILKEFLTSPAVKYIAGGLATAVLTRLANNLSGKYPEISSFIRENMGNWEERFGDFRDSMGRESSARH